ncbi:hypothetical protein PS1_031872 [Malus domestica]
MRRGLSARHHFDGLMNPIRTVKTTRCKEEKEGDLSADRWQLSDLSRGVEVLLRALFQTKISTSERERRKCFLGQAVGPFDLDLCGPPSSSCLSRSRARLQEPFSIKFPSESIIYSSRKISCREG